MPGEIAVVPDRLRRALRPVLAAAVVLVVLAGAGLGLRASADDAPAGLDGVQALLLTGSSLSYVEGQAVAADLGWDASVYTLPGGGISRSVHDPGGSITRAARTLLPAEGEAPDVVVLQGGEADHVAAPEVLERATQHLLDYVRVHAGPQAQLVLVGPIPSGAPPASIVAVNDVLRRVADQRRVLYIDPIAEGWQARSPGLPLALADVLAALVTG